MRCSSEGSQAEARQDGKGGYFITLPQGVVDRLNYPASQARAIVKRFCGWLRRRRRMKLQFSVSRTIPPRAANRLRAAQACSSRGRPPLA